MTIRSKSILCLKIINKEELIMKDINRFKKNQLKVLI